MISSHTFRNFCSLLSFEDRPRHHDKKCDALKKLKAQIKIKVRALDAQWKAIDDQNFANAQKNQILAFLYAVENLKNMFEDVVESESIYSEQEILKSPIYPIATHVSVLLHKLTFDPNQTLDDLKHILEFTDSCEKDLPPESSLSRNFGKAIATIAIAAIDSVIATALGSTVGLLATTAFVAAYAIHEHSSSQSIFQTVIESPINLIAVIAASAIMFPFTILASPFIGAHLGKETGKEWTGIPKYESVGRFLLFKQSALRSAVENISKKAKELVHASDIHHTSMTDRNTAVNNDCADRVYKKNA